MVLAWFNQCGKVYGTWDDLIPIVRELKEVLTMRGVVQSNRVVYSVVRVMEEGGREVRVGDGVVWGRNEEGAG